MIELSTPIGTQIGTHMHQRSALQPGVTTMPAAATSAAAPTTMLAAAVTRPLVPGHATQVLRSPVCEQICQMGGAKLVLVRAPAGFGKSTAMRQSQARFEADGIDSAWLTLDRADNDVPRFLCSLRRAVNALAESEFSEPDQADPVEMLARHDAPFVLFLDDFELIQEPAVLAIVRQLIDHLPRRAQIVLGSRSLPDLGLGRLRARGQLVEVDVEHLRFSFEETEEFFKLRAGVDMSRQALAKLHRKTEGWVAAIWLASMVLDRHGAGSDFIERFSGSTGAVADYLAEDVLAHQSEEVRGFLLRTSILRHLSVPLCKALNPRVDCARVLQQLDAANIFVTPIADEDNAWRYHSLFADFLQAQFKRQHPEEFQRLHLTASGWYEEQGRPVPAIDHAVEGGDFPHAMNLLLQHAEDFLAQGRLRLLARWLDAVPEAALQPHPILQVMAVWAACFTQGPWEALARLERLPHVQDADVAAHTNALRPLLLAMMDRYEDAYAAGRESLARLPTNKPLADSVLINTMASVASVMGEYHEAHRLLDAARAGSGTTAFVRAYTESMEGLLDLQEGRLRQAAARFRMVTTQPGGGRYHHSNNAWSGVLYAITVYEENRIEQAEQLLNIYLPLARDVGLPDHMIASHVMRSRLAFHRGDVDVAIQVLTELEYLGHHRQLPRVVCSAKLERAHVLMLQGYAQASREELDRADNAELWSRVQRQRLPAHETDDMEMARLRWEVRFGDAREALPRIERAVAQDEACGRHRRVLKLRLQQALAQQRVGDVAGAMQTMGEVLHRACPEGFMRLVLDEGEAIGALVHRYRRYRDGGTPAAGPQYDPIFDDYLQRLLEAIGPMQVSDAEAETGVPADVLQEPLTRKEIRVLQLLAEGYSNGAMAEKLFVSDSTVRTHLRNINMKLNAKSRTQAVAVARKLAVIR